MWHALENLYRLSQPAVVWQREVGAQYAAFREAFLQRSTEPARAYPCPRGCGCAHEVIQHAPGDIVAVCRCERWNCADLRLSEEEIVWWELNWNRLGRALCEALSLERRPADWGVRKTRQIGAWSAAAVPVILTVQPEARLFREALLELVSRLRSPFILLAPTARHLTAPCLEMLGRVNAGFFDLASYVRLMPGGRLEPARTPGELFMRFNAEPKVGEQSVFERAFGLVKALDAELLQNPTPLAVFRLYCQEGLIVSQIARKCQCSRGTVLNRLKLIAQRTGVEPDRLRQVSGHIAATEENLTDARARRVHRE